MYRVIIASDDIGDEIYDIMDELDAGGFDLDSRREILMGLGAHLGYDREEADYICKQILRARGIMNSTRITSSDDTVRRCRISHYNEFDNGRVLFSWKKMTSAEAEEEARKMSIEHPDDVYYVKYDNVHNPSSEFRYIDGKRYRQGDPEVDPYKNLR